MRRTRATPAKKTTRKRGGRDDRGGAAVRDDAAVVLTSAWCAWIANNILRGVKASELVKTLVASRVPRPLATRAVKEIAESPALHGVAEAQQDRRAGDLRARLMRELARAKATRGVERRTKPKASELFDRYWAGNQPVVFTDATKGWKLWTPLDMKRLVGDVEIVVTEGREADPHYDEHFAAHAKKTTVSAFVDRVLSAKKKTNDFYMVAQSKTMDRPEMRVLLDRIVMDEEIFDPKHIKGGTSLWLGPKGTVTPFHHDGTNIFFAQIFGRKQFLLAAPHEDKILGATRGYYADVDPEKPDLDLYPWWKDVTVHRVVLKPGEVLFLPVGWWHHVRSLDVSISLSLLNFRRPNAFDWYRPGFRD